MGATADGPRRSRDPYAEVGEATRLSHDLAQQAGCTPAEMLVLASVHYWLATYSRLGGYVSLAAVADKAGLWSQDDRGDDKRWRWVRKRLADRLQPLIDCGAIDYKPGRGGARSHFTLAPERGALAAPLPDAEEGSNDSRERGALAAAGRGAIPAAGRGAPTAPPYEKSSEDGIRGRTTRTAAPPVDGPPARRSAPAASDAWREEVERAMTERATVVPGDAAIRVEEEHIRSRLFGAIVADDDDDFDLDVAREAMVISDHLGRHLPPNVLEVIVAELLTDPPARPALALRTARAVAERHHRDLPRLDLSIGHGRG